MNLIVEARLRISALQSESGVAVPTIKFYVREGLLPPGISTGRNQAEYDDRHLERLRLIRVLTGAGKLTLSEVRQIVTTMDSDARADSCNTPETQPAAPEGAGAKSIVAETGEFFEALGWPVDPAGAEVDTITSVLDALRRLGCDCEVRIFEPYAQAVAQLAEFQRDCVPVTADGAVAARVALFEVVLAQLLRIAIKCCDPADSADSGDSNEANEPNDAAAPGAVTPDSSSPDR